MLPWLVTSDGCGVAGGVLMMELGLLGRHGTEDRCDVKANGFPDIQRRAGDWGR